MKRKDKREKINMFFCLKMQLTIVFNSLIANCYEEKTKSKSVWGIVLKVIITVATTLAGVFGLTSCINR